ncbi:hypothetical protein RB628_23085 [Streptomyces sp. ADMS]|uniref:hypothetical protein n=1 Tax=Streptomyces sp. ADMS TaxID=3071415 RepID=UPI00296EB9FF|nr:hypothetical protein [Streptomyces sp. ADMS]MDW4908149.1 hypothetical protein [Streptomyces sp. ADMS]
MPGAGFFHAGQKSPLITRMGRRLVDGLRPLRERSRPKGKDADGIPGRTSWDEPKAPGS